MAWCCTRGATPTSSEAEGLDRIGDGLLDLLRDRPRGKTMVLLEHTAGQGTSLGATFEQLATIIARARGAIAVSASASTPAICWRPATIW